MHVLLFLIKWKVMNILFPKVGLSPTTIKIGGAQALIAYTVPTPMLCMALPLTKEGSGLVVVLCMALPLTREGSGLVVVLCITSSDPTTSLD